MAFMLLLSSCLAFATIYKCSTLGTISFSKNSFENNKCCCCKETSQKFTQNEQSQFKCCHAITLEKSNYTELKAYSPFTVAVIDETPQKFVFEAKIKSTFPKRSAKVSSGVSPPVYLLKQSFLI